LNDPLILARAVDFIATMMAGGVALFAVFIAEPAFRKAGDERFGAKVRRQLARIAWVSLVVVVISGAGWLVLTAEEMSDRPPAAVFSEGVFWTVLARTGFGHDWLARFVLAGFFVGMLLWVPPARQIHMHRLGSAVIAAGLVGTLAWAGHAAATPGVEGGIHLTADILHLIAAAAWVGGLVPLAVLIRAASAEHDESSLAVARHAVLRFSALGVASVATLLATGIVNTWFLAGTVPALVGTDYGHLLLVKVALFLVMVSIAAVNRLWLTPRLAHEPAISARHNALRQLGRNSAIEATAGAIILVIVAVLGTMPPGLHQQATWPFPSRLDTAAFGDPELRATLFRTSAIACAAALIAVGIGMRRIRWPAIAIGAAIIVYLAASRLPTTAAYPTTFYASPIEFSTQSIAEGERLFATHCVSCHGQEGRGDGPWAALLKTEPADLTADHVYAHTDGDLFWWITHGIAPEMPGFGTVLDEEARWNLINFVRSNADATRLRLYGGGTEASFPTPNFPADCPDGSAISIDQLRGQIVHIVLAGSHSDDWLRQVVDRDIADKLRTIVITSRPDAARSMSVCATDDPETIDAFARYRDDTKPFEGTEFLVDAAGNLRSIWRSNDIANGHDAAALGRRVQSLRIAPIVARPAGSHVHSH
jgi:putative copper resistance protein D